MACNSRARMNTHTYARAHTTHTHTHAHAHARTRTLTYARIIRTLIFLSTDVSLKRGENAVNRLGGREAVVCGRERSALLGRGGRAPWPAAAPPPPAPPIAPRIPNHKCYFEVSSSHLQTPAEWAEGHAKRAAPSRRAARRCRATGPSIANCDVSCVSIPSCGCGLQGQRRRASAAGGRAPARAGRPPSSCCETAQRKAEPSESILVYVAA
ncbi:hypothetical protein EVAR_7701_1 [Eumeta japonica]|uniref:Uncharacterized protein n=1 Tax=Eumeta variegata TaxID=151549 RepID=A0A4C1TIF5_EUMVA|nr:hypothetical protein EVAR_7701_1 [Eumeta japonica]